MKKHLPKIILAIALAAGGVLYCQAQKQSPVSDSKFRTLLTTDNAPLKRTEGFQKSYADILDKVEPAVVKISTYQNVTVRRSPWTEDPFLRRWLGIPDERPRDVQRKIATGLGSGVITTKDGYIITNDHVVQQASEIKVSVPGREKEYDAEIINADPDSDVAVIKIKAAGNENFPVATLADSSQVRRGDIVFAVGAPFGYEQSASMGIVSSIGKRNVGVIGDGTESVIQTDAAVNPGNSGGPLIDAEGRVIGINTAIFSNTGSTAGIGFAIPINKVVQVASRLVNPNQEGQSGYIGLSTEAVTPEMAHIFELPETKGVLVREIISGSPAETAGLKPDDILLDLQGRKLTSNDQLGEEIRAFPAGREVVLGIWRDKQRQEIKVTLADAAQGRKITGQAPEKVEPVEDSPMMGMKLSPLTRNWKRQLNLSEESVGLVVEEVEQNSTAARAGLRPGMVIVRINRMEVQSVEDAKTALGRARDGLSLLHVWQNGRTATTVLQAE